MRPAFAYDRAALCATALAPSVPLPPKLFSHTDQQSVWQSSAPEGATSGWGGRMGDLLQAGNDTATFTCINMAGIALFMSGRSAVQYQVSPSGNSLADQLKLVARMINTAAEVGAMRQDTRPRWADGWGSTMGPC